MSAWEFLLKKLALSDSQLDERGKLSAYQRDISPALKKRFNAGEFDAHGDIPEDADLEAGEYSGEEKRELALRDMVNAKDGLSNPERAQKGLEDLPDRIARRAPNRAAPAAPAAKKPSRLEAAYNTFMGKNKK